MEFTNIPPQWDAEGAEPTSDLKKNGFKAGYKPPASYFNFLFNKITACLKELQKGLNKVDNTADKDKQVKSADSLTNAVKIGKANFNGSKDIILCDIMGRATAKPTTGNSGKYTKIATISFEMVWQSCNGLFRIASAENNFQGLLLFDIRLGNTLNTLATDKIQWVYMSNSAYAGCIVATMPRDGVVELYLKAPAQYLTITATLLECYSAELITLHSNQEYVTVVDEIITSTLSGYVSNALSADIAKKAKALEKQTKIGLAAYDGTNDIAISSIMGRANIRSSTNYVNQYVRFATITLDEAWETCSGLFAVMGVENTFQGFLNFYLKRGSTANDMTVLIRWVNMLSNTHFKENDIVASKVGDGIYDLYIHPQKEHMSATVTLLDCYNASAIELHSGEDYTENVNADYTSTFSNGLVYKAIRADQDGEGNVIKDTYADVETGTWTPVFCNSNLHSKYNGTGRYEKIGNKVFIEAFLSLDISTPIYQVNGLPFTANRISGICAPIHYTVDSNANNNLHNAGAYTNAISLNYNTAVSDVPIGDQFYVSGYYTVS